MNDTNTEHLTLGQFVEVTGATARQVDTWATAWLFGPERVKPGSGSRRRFSPLDVTLAGIGVTVSPWTAGGHRTAHRPNIVDVALAIAWCSSGCNTDVVCISSSGTAQPFDAVATAWQRLDRPTKPGTALLIVPLPEPVPGVYLALLGERITARASGGGS